MKFLVLNGPNLNLLGIREPSVYGTQRYEELVHLIEAHAKARGVSVECVQTNHEGVLVDEIQRAYFEGFDGIILNPAAYTHTSVALYDAVKAVGIPTVEVHISDTERREAFRKISFVRPACVKTIQGHGFQGYLEAMDHLIGEVRS
ncbi:MAG: 3-dehydroquinate dehydratase [Lachnospiraceae bacterium]|nr:3-dehydroquinate dehydratase [Lachnospiraceae bacterium]